jgi:hypothetical protein
MTVGDGFCFGCGLLREKKSGDGFCFGCSLLKEKKS